MSGGGAERQETGSQAGQCRAPSGARVHELGDGDPSRSQELDASPMAPPPTRRPEGAEPWQRKEAGISDLKVKLSWEKNTQFLRNCHLFLRTLVCMRFGKEPSL